MKKTFSFLLIITLITPIQILYAADSEYYNISRSLENWLVNRYLQTANQIYTSNIGLEGNSVLEYNDLGEDDFNFVEMIDREKSPTWAEQPNSIKIPTPYGKEVIVSEKPQFSQTYSFPIISDTTLIYNLIPQKIYWYKIIDGNNATVDQGVFKTLGYMRAIYSPNVNNLRDIGGWKCSGGRLAYGKVYRGGDLERTQEKDKTILTGKMVGMGTDVDLRHAYEHGNTSSPIGINYKWYEILAYMYTMTNTWNWNAHAANSGYYKLTGDMIKYMVNYPSKGAFYYHCTAGADRTGTIIALIEALCGVSEEDIVKDWELTTFSNYEKLINRESASWNHKNATGDSLRETGELRSCFKHLYDNYGGKGGATLQEQAENWFKKNVFLNASDQKKYFDGLRSFLIEPETRSPLLIQDWGIDNNETCYLLTNQESDIFYSNETICSSITGKETSSDIFTTTDFINCEGFKYITSNIKIKHLVTFYDSSYQFLSGIQTDSSISDDTVLFDNANSEYTIPTGAKYIRINFPKYSNAYMVLSAKSLF